MRLRIVALAALALLTCVGYASAQEQTSAQAEMVLERASGRAFPVELALPGRGQVQRLAGTGIRAKTFFKVQVYAFGLYVSAEAAAASLANWRGRSMAELKKDDSFYKRLLEDDFGKSLRLVMTRTIGGDDMIEAFDKALKPRLRQAIEKLGLNGSQADLESFRSYFNSEELTKGSELIFAWRPGGTLVTAIQGGVKGEIESPALCWALFDVYLGLKPVSKGAKQSLISRLPSILMSRK